MPVEGLDIMEPLPPLEGKEASKEENDHAADEAVLLTFTKEQYDAMGDDQQAAFLDSFKTDEGRARAFQIVEGEKPGREVDAMMASFESKGVEL